MINAAVINKLRIGAIALAAGLALSAATIAQAHGGGGHAGGAYGGGGGHGGGYGGGRGGRGGYGDRRGMTTSTSGTDRLVRCSVVSVETCRKRRLFRACAVPSADLNSSLCFQVSRTLAARGG
jgi:hypothetical protein